MPRRKAKPKKIAPLSQPNHHSPASVQLQGPEKHSKMEGSFNGTLQDTQKVESLTEDKEVAAAVGKSGSLSDTPDGDIAAITHDEENREKVESGKVEETEEDVSESVAESGDAIKDDQVDNALASDTVELELKEEMGKDENLSPEGLSTVVANHGVQDTELPPPSEDNNELSSVSANEGLREAEVVESIKDMAVGEEEKNVLPSVETDGLLVLSSVVTDGLLGEGEEPHEVNISSSLPSTDVVSKEAMDSTGNPKSDESGKVPPTITGEVPRGIEKVGEQSYVQESSSYESAMESFQPSTPNVPAAESTRATEQERTEEPRSTENPTIVPVTQRQQTSWKSCCGLFEILRRGDR